MLKFSSSMLCFILILALLYGCTEVAPEHAHIDDPSVALFESSNMLPSSATNSIDISYWVPYEGDLPAYNTQELPLQDFVSKDGVVAVLGNDYVSMGPPAKQAKTIFSSGWKLRLDSMTAIAKADPSIVFFAYNENSDTNLHFLYLLNTETGECNWLIKKDSNLRKELSLGVEAFSVYLNGELLTDRTLAERIWDYHTSATYSTPDNVLDGEWQCYSMTFVSLECPALLYEINYGVCGEKLYITNSPNEITIGIPLRDIL